jgi:ankyrin repeat protein
MRTYSIKKSYICVLLLILFFKPAEACEIGKVLELIQNEDVKGLQDAIQKGLDVNEYLILGDLKITPLYAALLKNNPALVSMLIDAGAGVNVINGNGMTALNQASIKILSFKNDDVNRAKATEIVKTILRAGADADVKTLDRSPLDWIVMHPDTKYVVELLKNFLSYGANVNLADENGFTVLHHALSNLNIDNTESRVEIIKCLVEAGANINAQAKDGTAAMHYAILDIESLKFLLEKGAQTNLRTNEGWTPLEMALKLNLEEIVQLLDNR